MVETVAVEKAPGLWVPNLRAQVPMVLWTCLAMCGNGWPIGMLMGIIHKHPMSIHIMGRLFQTHRALNQVRYYVVALGLIKQKLFIEPLTDWNTILILLPIIPLGFDVRVMLSDCKSALRWALFL